MNDAIIQTAPKCSAISEDGIACIKTLYRSQSGEYWEHSGGHIFATEPTMYIINNYHYDAGALLAGESVSYHKPEDCDRTGYCAWREPNDI